MKIIGIDGGGTKTLSYLADEKLNILKKLQTSSSNYLSVGIDEVEKNLRYIIGTLAPKDEEFLLSLGLAGVSRDEDYKIIKRVLKNLGIENYILNNDAYIALYGAHEGKDGALLIAGTGSILYYKKNKKICRAGGYGHLLGDQGSGYSLGKNAIIVALETNDGLRDYSELLDFVKNFYSLEKIEDIIPKIYRGFEKSEIAKLSKSLLSEGIEIQGVKEIVNKEIDSLVRLLDVLPKEMKIALSGGLLENNNYYSDLLKKRIREKHTLVEKAHDPCWGALLIGKEALRKD